jgi:hypothetical protein
MNEEYLRAAILELLSDSILEKFMADCQITKTDIINTLWNEDKTVHNSHILTISNCLDILSDSYNSNWNDDGFHCIVYKARGEFPHTHCGMRIKSLSVDGSQLICENCKISKEGKKIIDSLTNSNFDMNAYHIKKTKRRITAAKMALKKRGIKYIYVDKKLTIVYDHNTDYWYVRDLGLIIKEEIIESRKKYVTVGVDKTNNGVCQKLDTSDLKLLKSTSIIVDVDSLNEFAAEYIKNKITSN